MTAPVSVPGATGAEAWLIVADAVMRGLNHAMSNRVATVAAVVAVLEPDDLNGGEDGMLATLSGEIAKLEETLRLVRMVPRNPRASEEPVRVSELFPDLLAAHEQHPELRDVPCELDVAPDVLPVLLRESALAHAMLSLLSAAKLAVVEAGVGLVRVRCTGDERRVTIRVEAVDGAPLPGAEYRPPAALLHPPDVALAAARWSLGGYPFTLETAGAAPGTLVAYELGLETMTVTRKKSE